MDQHPVPQHIASFEFKLFGNLTVRQFVTLAIPMGIAAAIFFSALPSVVRIPLSGLFGLVGLFAALVPINGRPLDKWLVSFIKAVLSPTQRVWIKETKIPQFLNVVVRPQAPEQRVPEAITAQGRERLRNYLRSLPKGEVTPLDVKEQIAIQRLGLAPETTSAGKLPPPILWPTSSAGQPIFAQGSLPQINQGIPLSMAQTPPAERYEGKLEESLPVVKAVHEKASPRITPHAKPYALPGLEKKLGAQAKQKVEPLEIAPMVKAQLASEANFTVESVIPIQTPGKQVKLIHGIGKTRARKLHFAPPEGFDLSKLPIRGERRFEISEELKKRFSFNPEDLFNEKPPKKEAPSVILPKSTSQTAAKVKKVEHKTKHSSIPRQARFVPKPRVSTTAAQDVSLKPQAKEILDSKITIGGETSPNIPLPQSKPGQAHIVPLTNIPNVLSGVVTNLDGSPLEKIILVVKDTHGIPVRALKTNRLGQFLSATPLGDGTYTIEIDSENYHFKPFTINLAGQILAPLEIKPES
jgi:hypothetical protein